MPRKLTFATSLAAITLLPRLAQAGMPSISFSDVARLRLQTISFFLMGLLLSAGVIMLIWNSLRRDFTWLPRLSYPKACGLVLLWGLLFVVVLTMISGARELLTPGAWEKTGYTYRLKQPPLAESNESDLLARRREKLSALGESLREYAHAHGQTLPASMAEADSISALAWELPELSGTQYIYLSGAKLYGDKPEPMAHEPEVYDGPLLILFSDGQVRRMGIDEIRQLVEATR